MNTPASNWLPKQIGYTSYRFLALPHSQLSLNQRVEYYESLRCVNVLNPVLNLDVVGVPGKHP